MPAPRPLGHQQLTVGASAGSLTVPKGASYAVAVLAATNGLRYRDDGTDPTAGIGIPIAGGATFSLSTNLRAVRLIRSGGADAVADIAYYDHDPNTC